MKSTEMPEENSINIRAGRKSSRPSVAAKMSQLASDKGDISYDSVLRIVGEEIDAEKKSKMLLRTSLLLLFSLLAVTAANAGLTFAVVEFAKDTKVDGGVMTAKDSTEAIKVASTDFKLVDGRMVDTADSPVMANDVATGAVVEQYNTLTMLSHISESSVEALGDIETLTLPTDNGEKTYKVTGYEMADNFEKITLTTASGAVIEIACLDGETTVTEPGHESRKLQRFSQSSIRYNFRTVRRSGGRSAGASSRFLLQQPNYQKKVAAANGYAVKHQDSTRVFNKTKNKSSKATLDYSKFEIVDHGGYAGLSRTAARRGLSYSYAIPTWLTDMPNVSQYPCTSGVANDGSDTYPCDNISMHSFLSLTALGFDSAANDVWGWSSSDRDFVCTGSYNHAAFVEVTDPNNPVVLATLAFSTDGSIANSGHYLFGTSMWADMKVSGSNMFIVNQRSGSSIWRVNMNQFLSWSASSTLAATSLTTSSNYSSSHNMQIYNNHLYTFWNSGNQGFYDCSINNYGVMIHSTSGNNVGCIARSVGGDMHDAAFYNYSGTKTMFIAAGQEYATHGTSVFNVNSPASPTFVYDIPFPSGDTTQGQMSHSPSLGFNGAFMIQTDEWDELGIGFSGTKTNGKMVLRSWTVGATAASNYQHLWTTIDGNDHQGYMHDGYYFLAAMNTGLHIFSVSTAGIGARVGYFDTCDATHGNWGFAGAWSVFVFPYNACNPTDTPGGGNTYYKTVISDRSGLFIVQPDFHTGNAPPTCRSLQYTYVTVGSGYGSGR